ncbi:MAG: alpha/beta hydrolase [Myxococcota bacterium]|nr:alpha/beta hydrolase [Myxococcota bacterium]
MNIRAPGRFVLGLAAAAAALVIAGLVLRFLGQQRIAAQTRIEAAHGVESLERVTLGGIPQSILVRGWDRRNPILLFLHGGPGFPEMAVSRLFSARLEEHFTVVHWDQRGSGKSYRFGEDRSSWTIQDYVDDTHELIELLLHRFGKERLFLVGHSWGTVLGLRTARDHPELLHAFVGIGQVVNWREQEEISYRWVVERARSTRNTQAQEELAAIQPPYEHPSEMWVERKWLAHFGGDFYDAQGMRKYVLAGALSPHYSVLDGLRFARGIGAPLEMWRNEIRETDFPRTIPRVDVPVYFFAGRRDYNTPSELVERYVEALEAPHKEMVWFERSAHSPNLEEPDLFQEAIVSRVLAKTLATADARPPAAKPKLSVVDASEGPSRAAEPPW